MKGSEAGQGVILERARVGDARRIAEMSRDEIERGLGWRWHTARVKRALESPDTLAVIARRDGREEILGFAMMTYGEERAHLMLFAVSPSVRRMGVGGRLLDWLEACARCAGITTITLEVRESALAARAFYERRGFEVVEILPRYYSGREHGVAMRRVFFHARQRDARDGEELFERLALAARHEGDVGEGE